MSVPPGNANASAGDRGGCELTKVATRSHTREPKSIRFFHPEKESVVAGYLAELGFKGFPASLPPASVFTSHYRVIYACALNIHASGREVNSISINDELLRLGLDKQLAEDIPQGWELWSAFADKSFIFNAPAVVQCLRDIESAAHDRAAHEILAKAVDGEIDRAEVLERLKSIEELSQTESLGSILAARAFDLKNPPPPAEARYMMREQLLASPGNIEVISAKSKVGKSGVVTAAIASTLSGTGDTLGFLSCNPHNHAVLAFDCEQSPADHFRCMLTVLARVHAKAAPPWLRSYRIVDRPQRERWDLLEHELRVAHKAHGGIHSVFLDGVADYVTDPNNQEEAFAAVERLQMLAVKYNTVFWLIVHVNPSSENGKTRGHLGSQLERKAETNLTIEKDESGVSVIYTQNSRNASILRADGPRFRWDVEKNMHVSCEAEAPKEKKSGQFACKYRDEDVLKEMSAITPMKASEIQRQCEEELGISKKSFYRLWNQLKDRAQVKLMGDGWVKA